MSKENDPVSVHRCEWSMGTEIYTQYHDQEWGVPIHDDRLMFEFLALDGMQAGLSWLTILRKRDNFRKAFDNFEPAIVANYNDQKVAELLLDAGIIRNRLKILATINNARIVLEIQAKQGSFSDYVWDLCGGKVTVNHWTEMRQIPAKTDLSDKVSKALITRGFKFCGSTIIYAFMQAGGMLNDHVTQCFRYTEVMEK